MLREFYFMQDEVRKNIFVNRSRYFDTKKVVLLSIRCLIIGLEISAAKLFLIRR